MEKRSRIYVILVTREKVLVLSWSYISVLLQVGEISSCTYII